MGAAALLTGVIGFLLLIGAIVAMVFYLITLMRAMNSLPQSERTMPGGLVFLTFIPYLGSIWLIVFTFITVAKLRKKTKELGLPGDGGLTITIVYYSLAILGGIILGAVVMVQAMSAGFGMMSSFEGGNFDEGNVLSLFTSIFGALGAMLAVFVVFALAMLALFIVQWVQIAKSSKAIREALVNAKPSEAMQVE